MQRGGKRTPYSARLLQFVVAAGKNVFVDETLPRERAAERELVVGEVHCRAGGGKLKDDSSGRGQHALKIGVAHQRRLHEVPEKPVAGGGSEPSRTPEILRSYPLRRLRPRDRRGDQWVVLDQDDAQPGKIAGAGPKFAPGAQQGRAKCAVGIGDIARRYAGAAHEEEFVIRTGGDFDGAPRRLQCASKLPVLEQGGGEMTMRVGEIGLERQRAFECNRRLLRLTLRLERDTETGVDFRAVGLEREGLSIARDRLGELTLAARPLCPSASWGRSSMTRR